MPLCLCLSRILAAYLVFALSDTVFHFIPNDKPYSAMLVDAIRGVAATGGDSGN
jgi:hypothetical protein